MRWLAVAVVGMLASGCGGFALFAGEADAPLMCDQQPSTTIPPMPDGTGGLKLPARFPINPKLAQLVDGGTAVDSELYFTSLTLHLTSGPPDFSFLQSVSVTLTPPNSPQATSVDLLAYVESPGSPPSSTLVLTPNAKINVLSYVVGQTLNANVQLQGAMPTQNWSFTAKPCFAAKIQFQY